MADLEQGAAMVETTNVMSKAIQDAMNRIKEVNLTENLIDQISTDDWLNWDASDEMALVADSDGLDDGCEIDDDALEAA